MYILIGLLNVVIGVAALYRGYNIIKDELYCNGLTYSEIELETRRKGDKNKDKESLILEETEETEESQ